MASPYIKRRIDREQVSAQISATAVTVIRQIAEETGESMSEIIRQAIEGRGLRAVARRVASERARREDA